MNIILTRPLNDTENLMQELFSLGHKIMHVPTLKIKKAKLNFYLLVLIIIFGIRKMKKKTGPYYLLEMIQIEISISWKN